MKISLDWLQEYVEINESWQEVGDILSDLGFPLEGMEQFGDDIVLDIEVTSNRGDCLSHVGVAREFAAATGRTLKLPELKESQGGGESAADIVSIDIEAPELCQRYTGRIIKGIKIGPAPDWMVSRLEAVGVRSVNNVVDATNYAMLETGQPPHAFDFDKIGGGKIVVRKAVKGERIVSIDETKCDLQPDMLVIADAERPVAIAGVMGGLNTEVSESTTTVLLEDAQFDAVSVRNTGRRLGISSEAAFRFERHVDTERIDWASKRTADLIVEVAGGQVIEGVVDEYPGKQIEPARVKLRFERLNSILGIEVESDTAVEILTRLGFEPERKGDSMVIATVPSWRHDISREIDIIEEVARCYGYDQIPVDRRINIEVKPVEPREKLAGVVRNFMNGCGFYETVNVTFVNEKVEQIFAESKEHLGVSDESRKEANLLRQSLLGSLMGVLQNNHNAKNSPCKVFEMATTFKPKAGADLPEEKTRLSLVCDSEFRVIKGVVEGLIRKLSRDAQIEFKPADAGWWTAGVDVFVGGKLLGKCGVVSDKVRNSFGLKEVKDVSAAELDFGVLLEMFGGVSAAKPIPRYPAVTRDLSLVVDEGVLWQEIEKCILQKAPAELEKVDFVGIYRGKQIDQGKKSVTVSLRFRDEDGTLTHERVDEFEKVIFDSLRDSLDATLRTA
ncbi:Phenylalanine--tRNA ligase beta subunit [Anaerohalosphaera lusitana]|uniref:Phenylalanine--tRNA ligase beta subunit n=1 Tax=Anaerohalosphaera lusitana TaxID=1936003 RepID=A0A1U9NL80_9BACT|nr:phenylalanine--tRNA ligase subunit beta [Anaerohalosphaera lusitana]AQT68691.1 Phenylalanine--tRNA ligase beta subunit [Anaerohalosphaera lusitana]